MVVVGSALATFSFSTFVTSISADKAISSIVYVFDPTSNVVSDRLDPLSPVAYP